MSYLDLTQRIRLRFDRKKVGSPTLNSQPGAHTGTSRLYIPGYSDSNIVYLDTVSGNDGNSGATELLAKLTYASAATAAGSTKKIRVINSGAAFTANITKPTEMKRGLLGTITGSALANIDNFAIYVTVYECEINNQKFTYDPLTPIVNNHFSHNGPFYFSGTFTSATSANGVFGMDYYYWPGCGYIHGGPFHWNNLWRNYSQPLILETNTEFTITPALDTPLDYFSHFDLLTP